MSNSISFTGALGKDAELRPVGDTKVLAFNVANNIGFGDKKTTIWFNCSMWGKSGESVAQYLKKGTKVFITGELTAREWEKDGKKGTSLEVRVNNMDLIGSGEKKDSSSDDAPF